MNTPFSADYFVARDRFRLASANLGWELESYAVFQDLTMDIACSPGGKERPTIVVSSGLHGVEGFFGSAVQLALLASPLSESVRWVFIHALNPYGFANLRRCNEDNIDLNRNFLLPEQSYSGSPDFYAEIDSWLNPTRPELISQFFWWGAIGKALRYGVNSMRQAIGEGQYEFPKGLMFGGKGPSKTLMILQQRLHHWVGESSSVLHLDFHTGLGKFGTYQLLMDTELSPLVLQQLRRYFDHPSPVIVSDQSQKVYRPRGSLGQWCRQLLQPLAYTYFCAEFGTYSAMQVLQGLRSENQTYHWSPLTNSPTDKSKERFRELFCPQSQTWRLEVLQQSQSLVAQAVQAVLNSN